MFLGLNKVLSSNFLCEIYRRMYGIYGEACFSLNKNKNTFTNGWNMGLPLWAWIKKIIYGVGTLSGKERVPGVVVLHEGHADRVLKYRITHHYWKCCKYKQCSFHFLRQNSSYLLNDPRICVVFFVCKPEHSNSW